MHELHQHKNPVGRYFAARSTNAVYMCTCRVRANTYSKSKYASVIREVGGWDYLQKLLSTLDGIAKKHSVDIATVASRWVLDQPQVPCSNVHCCFM